MEQKKMTGNGLHIRIAETKDAEALLRIYAPYVEETAITFEYEVPSPEEFRNRIRHTLERYPYIVAETEKGIVGYAYASAFKERSAYDWSVETSIYVDRGCRQKGIGRALYDALEKLLAAQNILNVNACIAYTAVEDAHLDNGSMYFHEKLGYRLVGTFHQCGWKFGTWYDMIWMEKMLGPHTSSNPPFRPFLENRNELEGLV